MKYTKYVLALASALGVAHASVVYDFSSLATGQDVNGYSGWSASQSNPSFPFGFGFDNSGNHALALGGAYVTANIPTETVSVAGPSYKLLSTTAGQTGASVTMNLFLVDSTNAYSDRDTFSVSVSDSLGNTLASLFFIPRDQDSTPESSTGLWDLSYDFYDGTGVHTTAYSSAELELYTLTFSFGASASIDFGSGHFTGTPSLYNDANTLGDLTYGWTATNGVGAGGDNILVVDNVTFVPEPSAALLGAVGALGLLRRRRA
jgi:hypothetical protein